MNRRDALKSLAALAGAAGISVTPVTAHEATDIALVIFRSKQCLSRDQVERFKTYWDAACAGTPLQQVKSILLDKDLKVEFVRARF